VPGCGVRSQGIRNSRADRRAEAKKRFGCVTTRGRNLGVLNGLGRELGSLTALLLFFSVLGFDADVLAMFGLSPRSLPAVDLPQAFRILAVALVRTPRLVFAPTPFAQATPQTRSAPSGRTAVLSRNLASAHGRCFLPRESSGRMRKHSLRALSKHKSIDYLPVYRVLGNKTDN
jgi:hypothetical protein